jgi:hypothetical protein
MANLPLANIFNRKTRTTVGIRRRARGPTVWCSSASLKEA